MSFPYSINDLSSKCGVTKQSIYNLIRKNQSLINDNSIRKQRKIYYNQTVMDFLLDYYDKASTENLVSDNAPEAEASAIKQEKTVSDSPSEDEHTESRIKEYESQIAALKAENERLTTELSEKEEERKELLKQNGALILALSQEKQEKMLLLPAPKKPLSEKIKGFFSHK